MLYIVEESDYDNSWAVAAYESKEMADKHALEIGASVTEIELSASLPPEIADPVECAKRGAKREAERISSQEESRRRRLEAQRQHEWIENHKPSELADLSLCSCEVFTNRRGPTGILWTAHGYCSYCGGWSPDTVRARHGDADLLRKIDLLDHHYRTKMRAICGLRPTVPV